MKHMAALLKAMFLLMLCIPAPVMCIDPTEERDTLIFYYFILGHTWNEICGYLFYVHNIIVTLNQMKIIMKRLGLRRRNVYSPLHIVVKAMYEVTQRGFSNSGYRTLWKLINTTTNVHVSQELVRNLRLVIDPEGVSLRSRHRLRRRTYISEGPNYAIHLDGYDKLKPYGIAIHGGIDGFSRKILWLHACYSNNDPKIVARFFLDYVKSIGRTPRLVRGDCGTENVIVRDIQITLRSEHSDSMHGAKSYIGGRSTANQRIEQFWGTLKHNFTVHWRNIFKDMVDSGKLCLNNPLHIECVRYCFIPIIQTDLDTFSHVWNLHRIRRSRHSELPSGIPNVLFFQPETYEAMDCSFPLPCTVGCLDRIQDTYTRPKPTYGCGEQFLRILEEISGTQRQRLPRPSSSQMAVQLYTSFIEIIDTIQ